MKAHRHLIKQALADGHMISVYDGMEWSLKRSTSYTAIVNEVEGTEDAQLRIRDKNGDYLGTALIIAYGVGDDDTVADWGVNENNYIGRWFDVYQSELESNTH